MEGRGVTQYEGSPRPSVARGPLRVEAVSVRWLGRSGNSARPPGHTGQGTTGTGLDNPYTHGYLTNLPPETGFPSTLDVTRFSPSYVWTAGAIVSTVDDLARFHRALFTGRLLRPAQVTELETTVPTPIGVSYGLGVYELATPCGPAWGHDGDVFGYATVSLSSLDGTRQVVVSLNSDRILTTRAQVDLGGALIAGFCGETGSAGQSLPLRRALGASVQPL